MTRRLARLNEQLKRELSFLISTRLRDPRIGPVTVVAVEVASDLGSAKVFVRQQEDAIGGGTNESVARLARAAPFLRRALGETLHLRRIPELRFLRDRSPEQVRRIEEVLASLASEASGDRPLPPSGNPDHEK